MIFFNAFLDMSGRNVRWARHIGPVLSPDMFILSQLRFTVKIIFPVILVRDDIINGTGNKFMFMLFYCFVH